MAFERNDIVVKTKLADALGETLMGFEHNNIVTTDVMNAAIAGSGGTYAKITITSTDPEDTIPIELVALDIDMGLVSNLAFPLAGEYLVPLGENGSIGGFDEHANVSDFSVTGDIEISEDDTYFTITGDGTIAYTKP